MSKSNYRTTSATAHFIMSAVFLLVWLWPTALGAFMVRRLMFLMVVEFFLIHACLAVGTTLRTFEYTTYQRISMLIKLGLLYVFFVGTIVVITKSIWPVWALALLLTGKLHMLADYSLEGTGKKDILNAWATMGAVYIFGAGLTAFLPMPELGITPEVARAQEIPGEGIWAEQPYRVIAFGVLYFAAVGFSSLLKIVLIQREDPNLPY